MHRVGGCVGGVVITCTPTISLHAPPHPVSENKHFLDYITTIAFHVTFPGMFPTLCSILRVTHYYSGTFHMHVTHYHTLYFRPHSSLYIMLQTPHMISRCMVPTLLPLHDSLGNMHASIMYA